MTRDARLVVARVLQLERDLDEQRELVRRLRGEVAELSQKADDRQGEVEDLRAELAELQDRAEATCDECGHQTAYHGSSGCSACDCARFDP